jgi:hypothetical protein
MAVPRPASTATPQPAIDPQGRRRIVERVARCVRLLAGAIGRDHERCGKAACARSRRCRGQVCEDLAREPHAESGRT